MKSRGIQIRDSPYSLQVHDTESFDRKILGEEFFDFAHPLSDKVRPSYEHVPCTGGSEQVYQYFADHAVGKDSSHRIHV